MPSSSPLRWENQLQLRLHGYARQRMRTVSWRRTSSTRDRCCRGRRAHVLRRAAPGLCFQRCLGTSATLVVTGALLVVTMFAINFNLALELFVLMCLDPTVTEVVCLKNATRNKCIATRNKCLTSSNKEAISNNKLVANIASSDASPKNRFDWCSIFRGTNGSTPGDSCISPCCGFRGSGLRWVGRAFFLPE